MYVKISFNFCILLLIYFKMIRFREKGKKKICFRFDFLKFTVWFGFGLLCDWFKYEEIGAP